MSVQMAIPITVPTLPDAADAVVVARSDLEKAEKHAEHTKEMAAQARRDVAAARERLEAAQRNLELAAVQRPGSEQW